LIFIIVFNSFINKNILIYREKKLTLKMNKKEISMTTKKRLVKLFVYTGEAELDLELAR